MKNKFNEAFSNIMKHIRDNDPNELLQNNEACYALACVDHILKPENYAKEKLCDMKNWTELTQYCHSILCYEIRQIVNITIHDKIRFVEDVEFSYKFIHPAIASTFKYTYSDQFSISYVGSASSFFSHKFKNHNSTNTQKQILLIAAISALQYLETKGTSIYCLSLQNLIFNKNDNPKFLCAGIPSIFKPKDFSPAQTFGKFAKSLLSEEGIPSAIMTFLDHCDSRENCPSLQDIYDFFTNENRFLDDVDTKEIEKYMKWLKFQDKFPCEYFYDLNESQINELTAALDQDGNDHTIDFIDRLLDGISYPERDAFAALYYSKSSSSLMSLPYYASFEWFINLNEKYKRKILSFLHNLEYFKDAQTSEISKEDLAKLNSADQSDVNYVIDSYLNGTHSFFNSSEAVHRHIKNLLKKPENKRNAFLYTKFGEIYENGIGVIVNYEKALKYYKVAYKHDAHNEYGINEKIHRTEAKLSTLSNQIDSLNEKCITYLRKANNNEFNALMHVAFSFLYGFNGFPLSQMKAKEYYTKASEKDPYVLCMLGNMYRRGIGFPKNIEKAAKLYAKANIFQCPRGRAYHGFMVMRDVLPFQFYPEEFENLDRFFFDYDNQQGESHWFLYCHMIQISQCHFPLLSSATTITGEKKHGNTKFRSENRCYIHLKEKLQSVYRIYDSAHDILSKTDTHISLWFLFFQLDYMSQHQLSIEDKSITISHFARGKHMFLAITNIESKNCYQSSFKSIYEVLDHQIKNYIHPDLISKVSTLLSSHMSFIQFVDYFQTHLIDPEVETEPFEEFIQFCRNFVPYDSAKIAVSDIVEKANSGHLESIQECAFNYFYGIKSFPINFQESFKYYRVLSGDLYNDSTAQMWLGIMYSKGIGVNQDYSEALRWFKKSSDQKNVKGKLHYALFLEYYNKEIRAKSEPYISYSRLLEDCCIQNDKESLFQMGKLRESYPIVQYGRENSIKYYRMAYKQGHIESAKRLYHVYKRLGLTKKQNSLLSFLVTINDPKYIFIQAQQYYDQQDYEKSIALTHAMLPMQTDQFFKLYGDHLLYGHGIKNDIKKAKKYYLSVADTYPPAIEALANIYIQGIDCEPDIDKARAIYFAGIKAAPYSIKPRVRRLCLDFCEKYGYYGLAFQYHEEISHRKGKMISQYKVAMAYLNPLHNECKKNYKKGLKYLQSAANQNFPDAEYELGCSYIYGKYDQVRDFTKGLQYLLSASQKDHCKAAYLIGRIYYDGIGTIPDHEKSKRFFLKAAKKDHPKAKYYVYLNSDLDYSEKNNYLQESADAGYRKAQYAFGKQLIESSMSNEADPEYMKGLDYLQKAAQKQYVPAQKLFEKLTSKNNE